MGEIKKINYRTTKAFDNSCAESNSNWIQIKTCLEFIKYIVVKHTTSTTTKLIIIGNLFAVLSIKMNKKYKKRNTNYETTPLKFDTHKHTHRNWDQHFFLFLSKPNSTQFKYSINKLTVVFFGIFLSFDTFVKITYFIEIPFWIKKNPN